MNTIKLVHTYVGNGNVGAFFKTGLSPVAVGKITSLVHFLAEDNIDECIMLHEDLQAEIITKFFDTDAVLLEEEEVDTGVVVNILDQYVTREDACCDGESYKYYCDTFKGTKLYKDILQFILDNPTKYDV